MKQRGSIRILLILEAVALLIVGGLIVFKLFTGGFGTVFGGQSNTSPSSSYASAANQKNTESIEASIDKAQGISKEATDKLNSMTMDEKLAQMLITTPEGLADVDQVTIAGEGASVAIDRIPVGGIIYSDLNLESSEQLANLIVNMNRIVNEKVGLYNFNALRIKDGNDYSLGISGEIEIPRITQAIEDKKTKDEEGSIDNPLIYPEDSNDIDKESEWVMLASNSIGASSVTKIREAGYTDIIVTDELKSISDVINAVNAGADMVFCSEDLADVYKALKDSVQSGIIKEDRVNQAVSRIIDKKLAMTVKI